MPEGRENGDDMNKKDDKQEKAEQADAAAKSTEETKEKKETAEVDELKDRLLRLAAEFDNYKKRTAKETDAAKSLGKAELVRKLLPVLDEFGLAMDAIEAKGDVDKGVALVFSNLVDALKKEGLREIDAKGAADPYRHEAILTKGSDKKEGEILEVVRKGYELNGIMLRPASVIVSKGTAQDEDKKV